MLKGVFNVNNRQLEFMVVCSASSWPKIIYFAMLNIHSKVIQKILAFSNLKFYFIYFNNSLYNTPNIKSFILTNNTLK